MTRDLVSVIIPTLNAGPKFRRVLELLWEQTVRPFEVLIIDSSSTDETVKIAESLGARIIVIERNLFDHGATRNLGADSTSGDILVFLTQDATPADNRAIENLIKPLREDDGIALSYGRHIPKAGASPLERFIRSYNYRAEPLIKDVSMLNDLGIRTFTSSNVFSAVKRSMFTEAGRFPERSIVNEDMILSARLILKGYKIAYEPTASVYHSHNYSLRQQFCRYFDIGVSLGHHTWILDWAKPDREGIHFLKQEIAFLRQEKKYSLIPYAIVEAAAKYMAYRLGLSEKLLPTPLKKRFSLNPLFWDSQGDKYGMFADDENPKGGRILPTNVVHVAESFAGGTLDFLADLTNGMPDFTHIIIHGMREDTPKTFEKHFPQRTIFYRWGHVAREISPVQDMRAFIELIALLKSMKGADVIHLHSSKAGFMGRLACRMLSMQDRVIYSPHCASFMRKDISDAKRWLFALLEKTAAKFGGEVIGSALSEAEAFRKEGIRAMHINNGIACEGDPPAGKRHKTLLIGTSARITNQKNPSIFNEIARAFVPNASVRFLWIGDGELRHQLSSPNIQIAGWLPKDALKSRLHDLDIYLSTSLWEGMPLSVLMAMCAGKPLILFDCAGNRDLVDKGLNGFIFRDKREAVECIEALIANRHMIEEMGKCSRALALNNFTLGKMICHYRAVYLEIARKAEGNKHRCSA